MVCGCGSLVEIHGLTRNRKSNIYHTICTPPLTRLDSCVASREWQCCGAGHPRSYPPPLPSSSAWTEKMLSGLSTNHTMWRCDTELKLPCCNVYCGGAHWLYRLFDVQFSSMLPSLSDVRISPTLANRPTCLHLIAACNYGAIGPTRILG